MTQMINTESNSNGVVDGGLAVPAYKPGNSGIGFPAYDKQPQGAIKKTALRDVQNQNGGLAQNQQENLSFLAGGSNKDAVKVCGTKRLTPERPSSSPFYPALANSCANEHIMNARRRFELELGKGKIQSNMSKFTSSPQSKQMHQLQQETPEKQTPLTVSNNYCVPVAAPSNFPTTNTSFSALSAPNFLGKFATVTQAIQSDSLKVTLECPNSTNCNGTDDQLRTERFIRLQKFLKECDESDYRDYIQALRQQSPADLSIHAKELENRSYKLTIEDAQEIHRMNGLDILGKSSITSKPSQGTQHPQPRK